MTCEVCWALVPRALMHFHREWHDASKRVSVVPLVEPPAVVRG